jgi:lipopolysaccharide transport system ATP-binding protein
MSTVLKVQNVSKNYKSYRSLGHRALSWFGIGIRPDSEFQAVTDVSFELKAGEVTAIIGANGAGKSTLLKMITGTVRPTTGRIGISGRVNALLELGLGFNPEFTGRQNVYMSAGMMGLSTREIDTMLQEVIEFAEIGEFFEMPLRIYSSGMQARLAFAVATVIQPDVLIVDEVLSVGDAYFQHKSFDRIRRFKEDGVAILLVSHSMADVRALCDRAILLEKGRLSKDGSADEVVDFYHAMIASAEHAKSSVEQHRSRAGWAISRSGTFEAIVKTIKLMDQQSSKELETVRVGQDLKLIIEVSIANELPQLVLGFMIRDRTGHVVYGTNTWHTKQVVEHVRKGEIICYTVSFVADIGPGSYSISPALVSSSTHLENNFEWIDNVLVFEVVNTDRHLFIGSSSIDVQFDIERRTSCNSVPNDKS